MTPAESLLRDLKTLYRVTVLWPRYREVVAHIEAWAKREKTP